MIFTNPLISLDFMVRFYYRPLLQRFYAEKFLTISRKLDLNLKFERK